MNGQRFDFVIIGGGLAGCILASRLSHARPDLTVALVEAGQDVSGNQQVQIPMMAPMLHGTEIDWKYTTTPQAGLEDRKIPHAAGKALSGSAALNYGAWMRGDGADLDHWAHVVGDKRWSFAGLLPYFNRAETYHDRSVDPKLHGFDGPIHTCTAVTSGRAYKLTEPTRRAWESLGFSKNPDGSSGSALGLWEVVENRHNGLRQLPSSVYPFDQKNLSVFTGKHVSRILFNKGASNADGSPRAVGVEALDGTRLYASKEVILSAGAYRSPQVLMLSGVGPAHHLKEHNIDLVADNSFVGQNFCDHLGVYSWWKLRKPQDKLTVSAETVQEDPRLLGGIPWDWCAVQGVDSERLKQADKEDDASIKAADGQSCHIESFLVYTKVGDAEEFGANIPDDGSHVTIGYMPMLPTSRGSVSLQSADPKDAPVIDPNYLSTKADQYIAREAYRTMLRLALDTSEFKELLEKEAPPAGFPPLDSSSSDAALDARIAHVAQTHYHPSGSVSMGTAVDADCNVIGVQGLRVVDASVIPVPLSAHIQASVGALAEQAADIIATSS